jgi:hypothetical protein
MGTEEVNAVKKGKMGSDGSMCARLLSRNVAGVNRG